MHKRPSALTIHLTYITGEPFARGRPAPRLLPKQLKAEFQHSRRTRSRHCAVRAGRFPPAVQPHRGIEAGERGVIDYVEGLRAELQPRLLLKSESLQHREV